MVMGALGCSHHVASYVPLINSTTKPILGIVQDGIVIDREGLSNEDKTYSGKKHKPKMTEIIFIGKSYHGRKGRPCLIGNVGRTFTSGWIVPINNGGGGPFTIGGNGPPGSGGSGPPGVGGNEHLKDQNPRSYIV
jgi:hypothetical protein